ncbi:glycosyltransferase family 2 protein [Marinicella rhabdoformis]|uniref:glycosyltransferase family 2 protein n=1 Tax=Marinicella rhabdoformis TaxID=2580566 RepID=UPI0012AED3A0|nr:glycosyltransferase [Marinicella rhabdoformis]
MQVVIPVFNAFESLSDCVASLVKHSGEENVVFINDASTDARVLPFIESMCEYRQNWQFLNNSKNLGFVKTANRGLKLTSGHTVLLNSDTLVTTGWLAGLKYASENCEQLGTATPWSNNAEICSFPCTLQNNLLPKDIDEFTSRLQSIHQATYPEIPTAVGFCMLVTAQAKKAIGYFDETVFGHGYGEENDYSLRVKYAGLKNILCDNVYVAHIGNQSFKDLALKPSSETMNRLLAKHPEYAQLIAEFIEKDALASLRESIIDKIGRF